MAADAEMVAKSKHGRTRDVAPVSFRVSAPVRAGAEAIAAREGVTVNELGRECLEARVAAEGGVTPKDDGPAAGESPSVRSEV